MANWIDIFSLIVTVSICAGVIYGILSVTKMISEGVKSTKENLKSKGLVVNEHGMSVKTSKRFDRDDYVDATQRGIIKAMGAASFRKGDDPNSASTPVSQAPGMHRAESASSQEKKSMFGRRRKASA